MKFSKTKLGKLKMTLKMSQYMYLVGLLSIIIGDTALGDNSLSSKTYVHTALTGERITCNLCPPGTHLEKPCTVEGGDSLCKECEEGYFNDVFNQAAYCSKCAVKCRYEEREEMSKNCTKDANISCSCKDGFYRQGGFGPDRLCLRIEPCPAGEGVVTEGNGLSNTVCEKCPVGHFSSSESLTEKCQPCSGCGEDEEIAKRCTSEKDSVCQPARGFTTGEIVGISVAGFVVLSLVAALVVRFSKPGKLTKGFKWILSCCGRRDNESRPRENHASGDAENHPLTQISDGPPLANSGPPTENGHAPFVSGENETLPHANGVPPRMNSAGDGPPLANGGPPTVNGHAPFVSRENETLPQADGVPPRGNSADVQVPPFLLDVFKKLRDDLVHPDYMHFFRLLLPGNAERHLNEINLNFKESYGVKEVIYRLLLRWYDLEREGATKEKLIQALQEWGRTDLVRKYSGYPGWT